MKHNGIVVAGYIGTWYVIDSAEFNGKKVFLLESEIFGDEAAGIIVDDKRRVIAENVWNGLKYELEQLT